MFKNTITCIPIAPPPLCGIPDADTVRSLYDYTLWLDSLPDYGLLGYNSVLRQILVNTKTESVSHVAGRLYLHTTLHGFENKLFERQGWEGLPGSVPPLSPQDEKSLISPLLEGLNTLFKMNLDTLPNLSRDTVIFPTGNLPVEEDMAALFIGSSNADRLANSASTLGIITKTVTSAGWVLSTDAVTAILPQVIELCNSLPEDAPVVIYCLDNSSFCCANKDGHLKAQGRPLPCPGRNRGGPRSHLGGRRHKPQADLGGLRRQALFHHHARAQVPYPALLLHGGPLHPPPDSGFWPQTHAGSGSASAVHLEEAGREWQVHRHPGLRPPDGQVQHQPGGDASCLRFLGSRPRLQC